MQNTFSTTEEDIPQCCEPEITEPVANVEPKQAKSRRGHNPRSIEELAELPVSEFTPVELQKYVSHLREENNLLHGQLITLRESFEGALKQKQAIETEYQQLKRAALIQVQFCKDTVAQAHKTLTYMAPLEA